MFIPDSRVDRSTARDFTVPILLILTLCLIDTHALKEKFTILSYNQISTVKSRAVDRSTIQF